MKGSPVERTGLTCAFEEGVRNKNLCDCQRNYQIQLKKVLVPVKTSNSVTNLANGDNS